MRSVLTVIWRLLAFIGKELVETVRRPGAIVSLIVGPFLIMALFGAGFSGIRRPLDTIVVAPASSELPADPADYQALAGPALHIDSVVQDRAAAETRLRAGEVDVLVVAPDDPEAAFRAGKRSTIDIVVDAVDPVRRELRHHPRLGARERRQSPIIERAVEEGQGYALQAGDAQAASIPPRRGRRADRIAAREPRRPCANRDLVLRTGRPCADPAAPRGHARLDVPRPVNARVASWSSSGSHP
jgi:hypothetical protein